MTTPPGPGRPTDDYVFGVSAEEDARLALQHEVLAPWTQPLWVGAGLTPGQTILDLGCGPGHASIDLARCVGPRGTVLAVDRSEPYLGAVQARAAAAGLSNIRPILSDAQDLAAAPIPAASIDVAVCRYLLCYPPRPDAAVAALAGLLRPGGGLVIQDFFNYEFSPCLAPRSEVFDRVTRAIAQSIRTAGGDPDIAGRLPAMLAASGFSVDHIECQQLIARPGTRIWEHRDRTYRSFVDRMVELGEIDEPTRRDFFAAWEHAAADPNAFALCPTIVAIIARRL